MEARWCLREHKICHLHGSTREFDSEREVCFRNPDYEYVYLSSHTTRRVTFVLRAIRFTPNHSGVCIPYFEHR